MKMIRRVNFYGGPGCGKSTTSTFVFTSLKRENYNVEYIPEYVKKWTYYNRKPQGFDQIYLFGKQLQAEDLALRGGFDTIVSDSPIFLSAIYAQEYGTPGAKQLKELALEVEQTYHSLNIFLVRGDKKYNTSGRFQTAKEAEELDTKIIGNLVGYGINFTCFQYTESKEILEYVKKELK